MDIDVNHRSDFITSATSHAGDSYSKARFEKGVRGLAKRTGRIRMGVHRPKSLEYLPNHRLSRRIERYDQLLEELNSEFYAMELKNHESGPRISLIAALNALRFRTLERREAAIKVHADNAFNALKASNYT